LPYTLDGAAGRMVLNDDGSLRFERNGRTLLESGAAPAFALDYGVELPASTLAGVFENPDGLRVHYATALPELELSLEVERTDFGFRLLWSAPSPISTLGVCLSLRPQAPWYGQGERLVQTWPLDRLAVISEPLAPASNNPDGTLSIVTPLWLNAAGAGVLVEEGGGELAATLDRGGDGLLRIMVRAAEPGWSGNHTPDERSQPRLAVDVVLGDAVPDAYYLALRLLGHPDSAPPEELFERPSWSTRGRYNSVVDQRAVLEFAEAIAAHDFPRSVFEIDDRWQSAAGTLEFDRTRFPDPAAMVARLHELGFKVTLCVAPFVDPSGAAFAEATERKLLLRHPATAVPSGRSGSAEAPSALPDRPEQPYLVRWRHGYSGVIDVSNTEALDWWLAGLRRLEHQYGVDGFAFDAGEASYVPLDASSALPLGRGHYADRYVQWVNQHFRYTRVRCGWRSQRCSLLFGLFDKWSRWDNVNGLHSVLTQTLTLGTIGYPFVLPDMIGGDTYNGAVCNGELLARWAQLAALLPAMQFSIPPWQFGAEVEAICRRYTVFHGDIAPYIHSLVAQATRDGTPVVRPLFWHAPGDQVALLLDDEFLLGDLLLVAPVFKPGQRSRDVYLPAGIWRDRWSGETFDGSRWLHEYPAALDTLPLFERLG